MFCNKYAQMLFPAWLFISMMDNIWYLFVLKLSKFWKFLDCLENFQESCLTTKKVSNMLGKVWDWLESFQTDWNHSREHFRTAFTGSGHLQHCFDGILSIWLSLQSEQWSLQGRVWCWRRTSEFVSFGDKLFRFQPETLWTIAVPQLLS